MNGFSSPNHTQTPNDLFDQLMKDMSEAELKVVMAMVRKTLGYHKQSAPISLSLLEAMTGLSRQACIDGAAAGIERGVVEVVGKGRRGVNVYALVFQVDQSTEATSQAADWSTTLTSTSQRSRHTKEKDKEKNPLKKTYAPNGAGAAQQPSLNGQPDGSPVFDINRVFDCVAWTTFAIKDMRALRQVDAKKNPAGARIGKIRAWLIGHYPDENEKEVAAKVVAFKQTWKDRRSYTIPRDEGKFATEWLAWEQEKLGEPGAQPKRETVVKRKETA